MRVRIVRGIDMLANVLLGEVASMGRLGVVQ